MLNGYTLSRMLLSPARALLVTNPNCCKNFIFDGELSGFSDGPDTTSNSRARLFSSATASSSLARSSSLLFPSGADFFRAALVINFWSNKLTRGRDDVGVSDLFRCRCQVSDVTFGCTTVWLRSDVLLQLTAGDQCWDEPCRPTTRFNGVSSVVPAADNAPNFTSNRAAAWGSRRCTSAAFPFLSDVFRCSRGGGGLSGVLLEWDGLASLFRWLTVSTREATSNGRWNFCSGWVARTGGAPARGGIVNVSGNSLSEEEGRLASLLLGENRRESLTDLSRSCNNCCYTIIHRQKHVNVQCSNHFISYYQSVYFKQDGHSIEKNTELKVGVTWTVLWQLQHNSYATSDTHYVNSTKSFSNLLHSKGKLKKAQIKT